MGIKGDKLTNKATDQVDLFLEKIQKNDEITTKKMFGGYGIFVRGKMFGMIDSKGIAYLKTDEALRKKFEAVGGIPHSKMPYTSIPASVLADEKMLFSWVNASQKLVIE